jgi:hypothetical protein
MSAPGDMSKETRARIRQTARRDAREFGERIKGMDLLDVLKLASALAITPADYRQQKRAQEKMIREAMGDDAYRIMKRKKKDTTR